MVAKWWCGVDDGEICLITFHFPLKNFDKYASTVVRRGEPLILRIGFIHPDIQQLLVCIIMCAEDGATARMEVGEVGPTSIHSKFSFNRKI